MYARTKNVINYRLCFVPALLHVRGRKEDLLRMSDETVARSARLRNMSGVVDV